MEPKTKEVKNFCDLQNDGQVFFLTVLCISAAIQALKRKKRYEKQLQQIDGTLSTIEMQREALEGANTNTAVLTTMKNASDALKAAHQHMNVDDVHDMMDDIAEQQDVAKEISDAISNPVAFGRIWLMI